MRASVSSSSVWCVFLAAPSLVSALVAHRVATTGGRPGRCREFELHFSSARRSVAAATALRAQTTFRSQLVRSRRTNRPPDAATTAEEQGAAASDRCAAAERDAAGRRATVLADSRNSRDVGSDVGGGQQQRTSYAEAAAAAFWASASGVTDPTAAATAFSRRQRDGRSGRWELPSVAELSARCRCTRTWWPPSWRAAQPVTAVARVCRDDGPESPRRSLRCSAAAAHGLPASACARLRFPSAGELPAYPVLVGFARGSNRANSQLRPFSLPCPLASLLLQRHYITKTLSIRSNRTRRSRCNLRIRSNLACTVTLLPKRNNNKHRIHPLSSSSSICTLILFTRLITTPQATPRTTTRAAARTRPVDPLVNRRSGDRLRTGTFRSSRRCMAVPRRPRRRLLYYRVRVCIRADRSMRICRC